MSEPTIERTDNYVSKLQDRDQVERVWLRYSLRDASEIHLPVRTVHAE